MVKASREFQVFVKPAGARCNLGCDYCYYLSKDKIFNDGRAFPMTDHILETYIRQHINAAPGREVNFSWHGGEPTLLGIDFLRRVVGLQKKYRPKGKQITNGLQTNGTLIDDAWARFFQQEKFAVGLSLDGPRELHDHYRKTKDGRSTFNRVMKGYETLRRFGVHCDILCVVNDQNVRYPSEVYRFFKEIGARFISFLPLVEPIPGSDGAVSGRSVPAEAFGDFLCTIFDQWQARDIGDIFVQIFEEAARPALTREHSLCIFRETCGDIPVLEMNGDFYPCDHYVDPERCLGNIRDTPLADLLESPDQKSFGEQKQTTLPHDCRVCDVLPLCNGECPKNRFLKTKEGQPGLNYLCAGYKKFFHHCRPFLEQLAAIHRQPHRRTQARPAPPPKKKIGRNDPCPCGSGKKYKKCCLGK